jgi:hypothetical protein
VILIRNRRLKSLDILTHLRALRTVLFMFFLHLISFLLTVKAIIQPRLNLFIFYYSWNLSKLDFQIFFFAWQNPWLTSFIIGMYPLLYFCSWLLLHCSVLLLWIAVDYLMCNVPCIVGINGEEESTRCYLLFYYTYDRINMFRAPLCPSSGAHQLRSSGAQVVISDIAVSSWWWA